MSNFALGIIVGCFMGALGTLLLLLIVYNIPDADYFQSRLPASWKTVGAIFALVMAAGVALVFLHLRRVAFATSIFLLLVLLAAHARGLVISWMALAIAALALCLLLPPELALSVGDFQDQLLVAFFVLCAAVGTRLIAHTERV